MFALINDRNAINSRLLLCFAQSDSNSDRNFLKQTGKPSQKNKKKLVGECQGKHSQPDRMGCCPCIIVPIIVL